MAYDIDIFDLSTRYWGSFVISTFICILLQLLYYQITNNSNTGNTNSSITNINKPSKSFQTFQYYYLIVYLLAMFADWLQGPYVYELYELYVSYGYNQKEIAQLFVCGFGSSMIFGTCIGGVADKYGRKIMCIVYSILYIIACLTKLFNNYSVLMIGRFLSGIATSLLFSVFESWMVCEHTKKGYDMIWLNNTFAYATFGNGLVAVIAGLLANYVAEAYGYVGPFMVSIIPLTVISIVMIATWSENYGNISFNITSSLTKGFNLIRCDYHIAALGIAQSCFEGSMYTFVFMWTPALKTIAEINAESKGTKLSQTTSDYLGLIFAVYMICVMIGSSLFQLISLEKDMIYKIPLYIHSIATLSMFTISIFIQNKDIVYCMFLLFEISVGLFYPSYGVIKAEKIPEDIRSAVMNIFRIPLNGFVVILLLRITSLSSSSVFLICGIGHTISLICYTYFYIILYQKSSNMICDDTNKTLLHHDDSKKETNV